jgi:hypothetical protein
VQNCDTKQAFCTMVAAKTHVEVCWQPKCVPSATIVAMAGCGVVRHYSQFAGAFSNASTIYGHRSKTPHVWRQLCLARRCSPKNAAIRNRKNTAGRFDVVNAIGQVVAHGSGQNKSVSTLRFAILGVLAWGWLCCGQRSRPQKANGAAPAGRGAANICLGMAMGMGALGTRFFWPSLFFKLYKAM